LLFGRKDLIEAAKLNHSPHEAPIGRPMKVNKEEMFGMYAALKSYLGRNHQQEWDGWLERIEKIKKKVTQVESVQGETYINPGPANAFPTLYVTWDQEIVKMTANDVQAALQKGTPSIVTNVATKDGSKVLSVGVVLLRPDQIDIVARRVREILKHAI
jgi:seryl-tRNA(Sec) selenium transferase